MIQNQRKMSAEEAKRALEYREGDIVQIRPDGDSYSGRVGMIIGIGLYKVKTTSPDFSYHIKLSDNEGISVPCYRLRLIREAENREDLPESKSQFLPIHTWRY